MVKGADKLQRCGRCMVCPVDIAGRFALSVLAPARYRGQRSVPLTRNLMKTPSLSSHERVRRAFAHEDHDRIPRYDTYWPDTLRRWEGEGLVGGRDGALACLDADLSVVNGIIWPDPFPGRREIVAEDASTVTFVDGFGQKVQQFKERSTTPTHLGWECTDSDVWYHRMREAVLTCVDRVDLEAATARYVKARQEEKWTYVAAVEPFEILRKLIGDEETLVGMIEEPEWIEDIANVTTANTIANYERLLHRDVRPDSLWVYGDMAFNHATMCSPATYRELIWSSHRRLADWAHEHGMTCIYHTDGNVNGVIDLYLEAGFDALQPLECKAGMDLRTLCPQYGERLLTFGNVDVMAMIDNDLERIEAEVRAKLAAGMATKRYIYHSDHSIPPQVSWSTYQALVGFVDRYGWY